MALILITKIEIKASDLKESFVKISRVRVVLSILLCYFILKRRGITSEVCKKTYICYYNYDKTDTTYSAC